MLFFKISSIESNLVKQVVDDYKQQGQQELR